MATKRDIAALKAELKGMTKKERKAYQREINRIERIEQAKHRKVRRVIGWTSFITVAAVAVAGAGWWGYTTIAENYRGPADMLSDGIVFVSTQYSSSNTVTVSTTDPIPAWGTPVATTEDYASTGILNAQVYVDYTSADSATFWTTYATSLESGIVDYSELTVELHPIALDTSNDYAVRAVAAMGCVAEYSPDSAWDANTALLQAASDAAENGDELSVDNLSTILSEDASITDETTLSCVTNGTFRYWAEQASERAATSTLYGDASPVTTVPSFRIYGQTYTGDIDDSDAFFEFINDAYTQAQEDALAETDSEDSDASDSTSASASASASASDSASASSSAE